MNTDKNFATGSPDEYLATSFPDGDCEYLDGTLLVRNVGAPSHSGLQKILIVHLAAFERPLKFAVLPGCRTRIAETRYRVPDVMVLERPFRQTDRVVLDIPLLIIEILSPDDRTRDTLRRFRDYENLGVRYIVQMDPDDRTTHLFANGGLIPRDLTSLETASGPLPFDSRALLQLLDDENSA